MAKRILIYGDSNTYGQMAYSGRYPEDQQWCWILEGLLGSGHRVLQEGLGARIAGDYEVEKPVRNGQRVFEVMLRTALPIDAIIIALGTNDLKNAYNRSANDIVDDLLWYKEKTASMEDPMLAVLPQFIYVAPPNFSDNKAYFDADESKRQELVKKLQEGTDHVIVMHDLEMSEDGVHFSEAAHQVVAQRVYEKMKELNL